MSLLNPQNSFVSLADYDNPLGLSSVINTLQPELRQTAGQICLHMGSSTTAYEILVLGRKGTSVLQLWSWDMWSLLKSC